MLSAQNRLRAFAATVLIVAPITLSACAPGASPTATPPGVTPMQNGTPAASPGGDLNPVSGTSSQGRKGSNQ